MRLIDTVAWVHVAEGRLLGARSRHRTLFYIPGGKRHPGESESEALLREVTEELTVALLPDTVAHFGTYEAEADGHPPGTRVRMSCYTGDYRGTLAPSSEIAELAWLTRADRHRMPAVDHAVLDDLERAGRLV